MVLSSWIGISLPSITPVLAEDADRKFSHKSARLLQDRLARSFSEYDQLFSKADIEKIRVTDEAFGHYKCEISLQISAYSSDAGGEVTSPNLFKMEVEQILLDGKNTIKFEFDGNDYFVSQDTRDGSFETNVEDAEGKDFMAILKIASRKYGACGEAPPYDIKLGSQLDTCGRGTKAYRELAVLGLEQALLEEGVPKSEVHLDFLEGEDIITGIGTFGSNNLLAYQGIGKEIIRMKFQNLDMHIVKVEKNITHLTSNTRLVYETIEKTYYSKPTPMETMTKVTTSFCTPQNPENLTPSIQNQFPSKNN